MPPEYDTYWTVAEAAEHAKVKPGTIRQWIHREHLAVAQRDASGRPMLRPLDVARAEHATRKHSRSLIVRAA